MAPAKGAASKQAAAPNRSDQGTVTPDSTTDPAVGSSSVACETPGGVIVSVSPALAAPPELPAAAGSRT